VTEKNEGTRIRRRIDHLGHIRERLQDLTGFDTLANELIQNAEDAGAKTVTFDVRGNELVIENDASFTDCGRADDPTIEHCPFGDEDLPSCDWHNLTEVAAGQKRRRVNALGKFGIGFLAVYQLTDRPEIISGRHWALEEDKPEEARIFQCAGTDGCRSVEGTRIILPYARNPTGGLRQRLGVAAVSTADVAGLPDVLSRAAVSALVFLNSVEAVEVRREGRKYRRISALTGDGPGGLPMTIISGDGVDEAWYRLQGSFSSEAAELKRRYDAELIEPGRAADIRLAIPASGDTRGLLYAGLPSEMVSGLPFHLDARFFPSTDRKRMPFDAGEYRGQWNQAAMRAGARALAEGVLPLRDALGATALWTLFLRVVQAMNGDPATVRDMQLGEFRSRLAAKVARAPVAFSASGQWVLPSSAPVLRDAPEEKTVEVFAAIGIDPMDPGLRPIVLQGLVSAEFGSRLLTIDHVVAKIQDAGLDRPVAREIAPAIFRAGDALTALWRELERLQAQERGSGNRGATLRELARCAVAPSGPLLVPLQRAYRADVLGRQLAASLDLGAALLDESFEPEAPNVLALCPTLDLSALVAFMEALPADSIARKWEADEFHPEDLLDWIGGREVELTGAPRVAARLRALVAFPTAVGLIALDGAVLAGDFDDPLGSTDVLTVDPGRYGRLLGLLGVTELTFSEFARRRAPRALAGDGLDLATRRAVIRTVAHRVHDLYTDEAARAALQSIALVECLDGKFRVAANVVLDSSDNAAVLGATIPRARPPDDDPSFELLWSWLGLHRRPTEAHLRARIEDLTGDAPDADRVLGLEIVARHINARMDELRIRDLVGELRNSEWLPVRAENVWSRPADVYAVFSDYLFDSTGRFLAFRREVQNELSHPLFDELRLMSDPTTDLVVGHLLNSSAGQRPVNTQVWDFLARHWQDQALVRLRGTRCIWTGAAYRRPDEVFWSDHPFGTYRAKLPIENLRYRPFFDAVGVREYPSAKDAAAVLAEVSAAVGHEPVANQDAQVVRGTWELLASLVDEDDDIARMKSQASATDRDGRMVEPARLYFEDRPRLASLFDEGIRRRIIDFDPAIAPALRKAGARDLSEAALIGKLEPGDPRDDPKIDDLIRDRTRGIQRVVATVGKDLNASDVTALVWQRVDNLRVRYELPDEPDRALTEAMVPEALFIEEETESGNRRVIYVAAGPLPHRAMARELAVGLVGPRAVPVLAPALHAVLTGANAADVEAALDDLGLASLSEGDDLGPAVMEVAKDLGVDETDEGSPVSPPEDVKPGEKEPGSKTSSPEKKKGAGSSGSHSRGALRTFLPGPTDDNGEGPGDEEGTKRRTAVDRAGVDRVLAHEQTRGRHPKEMPHGNVGFDVESYDDDQRLVRIIEVKSMSGSWLDASPALSRPQHDEAYKRGPEYWLYVVERALSAESSEVHTIRNPIGQATEFGFDPGWMKVAERDAADDDAKPISEP